VRLDEVVLRSLEKDVARRYQQVSDVQSDVEGISGVMEKLPPALRRMMGFEYRSEATLFGWPLLHMVSGVDPVTGLARTARGIIAVADQRAIGVLAFGAQAIGLVAFGGIGLGLVTFSGLSFGVISMGGIALGLFVAYGGVVVAPYALGGVALGYMAGGGAAFGVHAAGGNARDPLALAFLKTWSWRAMTTFLLILPLSIFMPLLRHFWAERSARNARQNVTISGGRAAPRGTSASAPNKAAQRRESI
jgi:hypothetical protein